MMLRSVHGDEHAATSRFAAVLDQGEFRSELDRLCISEWHWGVPQAVRIKPLKWHRERCTFEIAVKTEAGWRAVIGKVYEVDRAGVFRTWQAVWQAGFGPGAEFHIPQPLAYLPSMRILLEEKVQGRSAKEILLHGTPRERIAAAERCGRWLARFHTAAPRLGTAVDIRSEFSRFRQWADQVTSFGQPFADQGARLFRELEAEAPAPGTVEYRAGHGSYIPEHVFLSGPRTTVIDLDEHDVADPGRDVAWFVVSLQRLAMVQLGSFHALDGPAQHFLESYRSAGRQEFTAHYPFYRALECLHRARRDLCKRVPPVREWAEIMLDEGLRAS
jgi:hypothetical protein